MGCSFHGIVSLCLRDLNQCLSVSRHTIHRLQADVQSDNQVFNIALTYYNKNLCLKQGWSISLYGWKEWWIRFFLGGGFHLIKWNYFLGVRMSSSWLTLTLHLDEFGVSLRLQFCFVCLGYLWFKINNYIFTFCVAPNWFLPCIERTALFIFMLCLSLAVNLLNFMQRTILILHYCSSVVTLTLICLLLRGRICELQPISPHMQRTKHSAEWSGSHVG